MSGISAATSGDVFTFDGTEFPFHRTLPKMRTPVVVIQPWSQNVSVVLGPPSLSLSLSAPLSLSLSLSLSLLSLSNPSLKSTRLSFNWSTNE